jgi:hypothetical protein
MLQFARFIPSKPGWLNNKDNIDMNTGFLGTVSNRAAIRQSFNQTVYLQRTRQKQITTQAYYIYGSSILPTFLFAGYRACLGTIANQCHG